MSKYGTQMTESELILAATNQDTDYIDNLLAGMTNTELVALGRSVRLLTERATEQASTRYVGRGVPVPQGYCKHCGTDLYLDWEHCPNCRVDMPLEK